MVDRRIVSSMLSLLGLGLLLTALLGPLGTETITYRVSENMEQQTLGGDAVLLALAAPMALLAALLWLRGNPLAPLLALAPASFTAYTYLGFILIPDYSRYPGNNEEFYPLFAAVLALSIALTAMAWAALGHITLPEPSQRLRRLTAGTLALIALFFGLTWGRQIADVMAGSYSTEYLAHPTAFWLIRTLDFAILIPASIATAIGLLRGSATALRSAYALTGFITVMLASIASMALVLIVTGDPAADAAGIALFVSLTAGLALLTGKLWNPLTRQGRERSDATQRDILVLKEEGVA